MLKNKYSISIIDFSEIYSFYIHTSRYTNLLEKFVTLFSFYLQFKVVTILQIILLTMVMRSVKKTIYCML